MSLSPDSGSEAALNKSKKDRHPCSIVWTPIPVLSWFLPFVGHMGITNSAGVIRDFGGPFIVSEDNMAFGDPTRYVPLDANKVEGGVIEFDKAVLEASEVYKGRMHFLLTDNCHSHVALALELMRYDGKTDWGMVKLAAWTFFCGRYVGIRGFVLTWLPFCIVVTVITLMCLSF